MSTALPWQLITDILISLGIGAVIGLERQSHQEDITDRESLGVRTFSLASLLGTVSVHASDQFPGVVYLAGGGYILLVCLLLYFEFRHRQRLPGITTQVSAILVLVFGILVPSNSTLAAVLAVIVAGILSVKTFTHRFVENLTEVEILSTLKFLLITVVLLPVLPNQPIDPWGIYNPRELWILVVLISGISFVGYFALRYFGKGRGIAYTGALGGLASSTAVTLSMCQRVSANEDDRVMELAATFAILIANAIMSIRVTFLVAAVHWSLIGMLWLPIVAMAIPGVLVAAWVMYYLIQERDNGDGEQEPELEMDNPFQLGPALKFALLFVLIIGGVQIANQYYGPEGTYVAAFLSGLADADAVSLDMARRASDGSIGALISTRVIVIAILSNSLVKAGISGVLGSRQLGVNVFLGLLPMIVVGIAVSFVVL